MTAIANLLDEHLRSDPHSAVDFISNVLESSTESWIIGKALDDRIVLWNEGARRIYGYGPSEVLGRDASSILSTPNDVREGQPQKIDDAALAHGKWEGVLTRVRKNGDLLPARVVIPPRRDQDASPIGLLSISKDVSEEGRLTDELQKTQLYTRSLIEASADALFAISPDVMADHHKDLPLQH